MPIFLIGLPGSGKTTLGKQVAKSLAIPFVDLDQAIEKAERKTITEIFKDSKEDYFRKVESELLNKWAQSNTDYLMATGGGAPCFFDNIKTMNDSGLTFFLDVPPMEIAHRIDAAKNEDRPLIKSMSFDVLKDQIEQLRSRRISYYQQAKIILIGKNITAEEMLSLIRKETQP